ncbi:MAG: hypothetical protein JXA23_06700 [Bacteroidales bacterium]|nr:hypothetical protein [Bacteroidales bacterium]
MKKYFVFLFVPALFLFSQCQQVKKEQTARFIPQSSVDSTINRIVTNYSEEELFFVSKGVNQVASLWRESDGSVDDFEAFCEENYVSDPESLNKLFLRLSENFEILFGFNNMVSLRLKEPVHLSTYELLDVDEIFAAYEPGSHFKDDFFANKVAFIAALNFPYYTLEEKTSYAKKWSRLEWAYARMGDMFTTRVPAEVNQKVSAALSDADNYISQYNIYVGNIVDDQMQTHFPKEMKLLSHWNLRDEIKANYNGGGEGLLKQQMIFKVMLHIINQDIPEAVINNPDLQWNTTTNTVYKAGVAEASTPEPDTRYSVLLNNFRALKLVDSYTPQYPTFIQRAFDGGMEISQNDVENLFKELCSSAQVKKVADLIKKRLGRDLQPFDIWYDGFKSRSSLNQSMLDKMTREKYPNTQAFEKDIPNILMKLGFQPATASEIASHITVDPARGSGHAWGASMKGDKAHLRTRIGPDGMDYKGYNIAMHELGHNVEQTISLYFIDYYLLQGVPNTAFTEALAFTFQSRDLDVLGFVNNDPAKESLDALDNFWSAYEIMGVSMVDMAVWQWMYDHPDATPSQLKETVIATATKVWNNYYADAFGVKDSPILAIYSHMIDNPLYLSNYPVGHLIDFQLAGYLKDKNFADEVLRIYALGDIIPQFWMREAVGEEISIRPLLDATERALEVVKE